MRGGVVILSGQKCRQFLFLIVKTCFVVKNACSLTIFSVGAGIRAALRQIDKSIWEAMATYRSNVHRSMQLYAVLWKIGFLGKCNFIQRSANFVIRLHYLVFFFYFLTSVPNWKLRIHQTIDLGFSFQYVCLPVPLSPVNCAELYSFEWTDCKQRTHFYRGVFPHSSFTW